MRLWRQEIDVLIDGYGIQNLSANLSFDLPLR